MNNWFLSAVMVFTGVLTACGGDSKPPPLPQGTTGNSGAGGVRGRGGSSARGGAGTEQDGGDSLDGGGGTTDTDAGPLAPIVRITAPPPASDPNTDPIISQKDGSNMVTVTCKATPGPGAMAKAIDATMVTLEMLDASGAVAQSKPGGTVPGDKTLFSADFIFTSLKSGKVSFRCHARDLSGMEATTTVAALVDNGPNINPTSPAADSFHSLTPPVGVEFTVGAAQLGKTDDGATVDNVALQIDGKTISLKNAEDPKTPGHYKLSVDLSDQDLFKTTPNGSIPISVSATNKRGVTGTDTYHFGVDSQGPTITITAPPNNAIIAGKTILKFTVDDGMGAGVDVNTVTVKLNKDVHNFDNNGLWTQDNGAFTFAMDSTTITDARVQVNVAIDARDRAANAASELQFSYYLDTTPPTVDLDPPDIQEVKTINGVGYCSNPFDPLGAPTVGAPVDNDYLKDHKVHQEVALLRALAWDEENGTADEGLPRFAGVDQKSVEIYVQGDVSKGLLIDTDHDANHVCDEVDRTLPTLTMYPVVPAGSSDYRPGGTPIYDDLKDSQICVTGTDSSQPQVLCPNLPDLTRVIQHDQAGGAPEPVVYALIEMNNGCASSQTYLDTRPGVATSGWVCLAARAVDNTGNVGVSPPMRLCMWKPGDPQPDCAKDMSMEPPSCTRDCVPPQHFQEGVPVPYIRVPL